MSPSFLLFNARLCIVSFELIPKSPPPSPRSLFCSSFFANKIFFILFSIVRCIFYFFFFIFFCFQNIKIPDRSIAFLEASTPTQTMNETKGNKRRKYIATYPRIYGFCAEKQKLLEFHCSSSLLAFVARIKCRSKMKWMLDWVAMAKWFSIRSPAWLTDYWL